MARCPKPGTRVKFSGTPAAVAFYMSGTFAASPKIDEGGTVTEFPTPRGKASCMPGPGGGMVYVDWDKSGSFGVFRNHLEFVKARKTSKPRRRR
jgi:hypothetical protein